MPSMLFLTQRIPYPPNKGEKIRPLQILKYFSSSYEIHLGCLIDQPDDWQHTQTINAMCAGTYFAGIIRTLAMLTCQTSWLTGNPLSFEFFNNRGLASWTDQIMTDVKPDIVFVCSSNMAQYVVTHPFLPKSRIIDFADVDSAKWAEYSEKGSGVMKQVHAREARLVLQKDRQSAKWANINSFVSEAEAEIFRKLAPESAHKTHSVTSGVDSVYFSPEHYFTPIFNQALPTFVFTGVMDYPPNIDAASWFATEIFPQIRAKISKAQFFIVGMNPAPEVMRLARIDGVHITGKVPDVRPYVAHAVAAVAPLRIARGIQNKVLEAMAMAKPVIVTPQASEGIEYAAPGQNLLVGTSAADIADLACKLVTGDIDGASLGTAARGCVVDHYSWAARLSKFETLLIAHGA